jgi:hypothetical protein
MDLKLNFLRKAKIQIALPNRRKRAYYKSDLKKSRKNIGCMVTFLLVKVSILETTKN